MSSDIPSGMAGMDEAGGGEIILERVCLEGGADQL